jgi:hypothetical protein
VEIKEIISRKFGRRRPKYYIYSNQGMAERLVENGMRPDKYAEPTGYLDYTDSSDSDLDLKDLHTVVQKIGIADNGAQHQQGALAS